MLCYRCGSYTPDGSRKCDVCGQPFSERRRTGRNSMAAVAGAGKNAPPFEAGALVAGRYRVRESAGQGTAGWVLRARDEEVDVDVGIKVIAPNLVQTEEDRARFLKSLRRAKKLHHPNIVRIYDDGKDEQHLFYTMPFLEGLTLRKIIDLRVEKEQVFSLSETLPLLGQLASGLDALDRFGAHGALRPTNVVVLPDVLKITGVAHLTGLPHRPYVVAQSAGRSLEYLAPEARKTPEGLERSADVYSLAVICVEMLCGIVYGREEDAWQHEAEKLPRRLASVLQHSLSDVAAERPATAGAFVESVLEAASDEEQAAYLAERERAAQQMPDDEDTSPDRVVLATRELGPEPPVHRPSRVEEPLVMQTPAPDEPVVIVAPRMERPKSSFHQPPSRPSRASSRQSANAMAAAAAIVLAGLVISAAMWWRHRERLPEPRPVDTPELVTRPIPVTGAPPMTAVAVDTPKPAPTVAPPVKRDDPPATPSKKSKPPEPRVSEPDPPPPAVADKKGCGPGMITIDGTRFELGSRSDDPMRGFGDMNAKEVAVGSFCVDVFEYPNQRGKVPTTSVSWKQAKSMCESRGKRLCTEEEWELACKGPRGARFPFGNQFDAEICNAGSDGGKLQPAGVFARCRSGFGVVDLAGNAAEWTASRWADDVSDKVVKGGAADQASYTARCAARANESAGGRQANLGFRCCSDP